MLRVTLFRPAALSGMLMAGLLAVLALVTPTPVRAQGAEDLRITTGKSLVIDYPVDVARISTSNPDIVDAVAVSTREILLHAKTMGVSTIVVWSKEGQRTFYNVTVEQNLEPARRLIKETFPTEDVQVLGSRDSLTLIGRASTKEMSERISALAASLAKTVVNNLKIAPLPVDKQVILRVKFVELDRNKSAQYGVNLFSTGFGNTPATIGTGQIGGQSLNKVQGAIPGGNQGYSTELNIKDVLNIFAFRPDLNLGATVRALQNQGVLQILAEPNLVTTVGKEASFLVGGEFPIPVLQGGSGASAVTIQFREFGIRLTFNPQLTENGTLKMYVKPEVSTIDLANSVTLNGFTIPALATRRMETNVELAQGQSFVIGGLIDDRVNEQLSKIPGLSSIPVLGALFKTRIENKSKSELIVMVTPELIDPLNPGDPKPDLNMPIDWLPALPAKTEPKKSTKVVPPGRSDMVLIPAEQQVITTRFAPVPEVVSAKRVAVPEPAEAATPIALPTVVTPAEPEPPTSSPEVASTAPPPAANESDTQAVTSKPAQQEATSPQDGAVPVAVGPSPAGQTTAQ